MKKEIIVLLMMLVGGYVGAGKAGSTGSSHGSTAAEIGGAAVGALGDMFGSFPIVTSIGAATGGFYGESKGKEVAVWCADGCQQTGANDGDTELKIDSSW